MSRVEQALRRANVTSANTYVIVEDDAAGPLPITHQPLVEVPEPARVDGDPVDAGLTMRPAAAFEKLVIARGFDPIAVEQYRKLAAALHQMQLDHGTRSVMVTSALPGEGKTLTAANLAVTLSESFQRRVLLIDADLRRPGAHDIFRVSNESGLSDELDADRGTLQSLIDVSPRLTLLPGGSPSADPMSRLTSARMQHLLDDAVTRFDWVVLDTPPVLSMPDASLLARMLDVIVFLVRAGKTPSRSIQRAMGVIDRTKIAGVVLNRVVEGASTYGYDTPR